MSCTAFIDPLPVVEFVAQILGKDVSNRPLSDADRIKVYFQNNFRICTQHFIIFKLFIFSQEMFI